MSKVRENNYFVSSLLIISLFVSSCSPTSYISQEGMLGGLTGTLLGSGVGWYLGSEKGHMGENIALNAAIGGGLGLLGGAMLYDHNVKLVQKREVVQREARLVSQNQREIDLLRQELDDASSWGRNETQSWDRRYLDEESGYPYQSSTMYKSPDAAR